MTTSAMPSRRDRSFISSRICAWMVTSSAVVGSSAMMSLGLHAKPDRDHHALAHAAGEVMRILFEPPRAVRDADQLEQFERTRRRLLVGHLQVNLQRLHHLLADGQHRVERGHRLLEDHRDVAAAPLAHLLLGEVEQVLPLEQDLALGDAAGFGEQAHDRERGDRLAAAGLAHDGDDLAPVDGVGNAFDRANGAARGFEVDVQIPHLQQRRGLRTQVGQRSHPALGNFRVSSCALSGQPIPDSGSRGQWERRRDDCDNSRRLTGRRTPST